MKYLLATVMVISVITMAIGCLVVFGGVLQFIFALYKQPKGYGSTLVLCTYAVTVFSVIIYLLNMLVKAINKRLKSSK